MRMDHSPLTPEEHFARIVEELLSYPQITPPSEGKKFGSSALKVRNKIFAMLVEGKLVLKLPRAWVDELVARGAGQRFDPRRDGRVMKEWIAIEPTPALAEEWLPLARAAMEFVASQG